MVTALSKDGKTKRELIYNESILMVNKYDSLTFDVKNQKYTIDLKFNFDFSDTGDKFSTSGQYVGAKKEVNLTLHNWYSPTKIENTDPIEINLKNGNMIWVKFGSISTEKGSFRMFHLTIWGGRENG